MNYATRSRPTSQIRRANSVCLPTALAKRTMETLSRHDTDRSISHNSCSVPLESTSNPNSIRIRKRRRMLPATVLAVLQLRFSSPSLKVYNLRSPPHRLVRHVFRWRQRIGSRWNVAAMSNTLEKHGKNTSVLVKLSNIMVPKVQKILNRLIVHKI